MSNKLLIKTALYGVIAALATGCNSEGDKTVESPSDANTFAVGSIDKVGEVDWYEYETREANQSISLRVSSNKLRPDIELLVGAYVMKDGKKELLYADHAVDGTHSTAQVNLDFMVGEPQTIYFSVRDLRDDEFDSSDPYRMTLDVATTDGTSSFEDAIVLDTADGESCQQDTIGERGDLDTFKINVTTEGVYHFITTFDKKADSELNLLIGLYDKAGNLIASVSEREAVNSGKVYPIIQRLAQGVYYILAKDQGNQYFDNYSSFDVCASQSDANEAAENDTKSTADTLTISQPVEAALEYDGDQDWYEVPVGTTTNDEIKVLTLNLDTSAADAAYRFEITVEDAEGKRLLTHAHNAGSDPYDVDLKVDGDGPYYVLVEPKGGLIFNTDAEGNYLSQAPYVLKVDIINVNDQYDVGEGNNTQATAAILADSVTINGKIAYRTDTDYYSITVPGDEAKVLEVYLDTENQQTGGDVDYSVAIIGDDIDRLLDDELGADAPTSLKTAMLTPALSGGGDHTYYIRVRDIGDNESNTSSGYTLRAQVQDIADSVPAYGDIIEPVYHSEKLEQIDLASRTTNEKLKFIINDPTNTFKGVEGYFVNLPNMDREFADDQASLVFDGDNKHVDFIRTDNEDGSVTFVTPWHAGYVDYQGDQDYFKIDFNTLIPTAVQKDEEGLDVLDEEGNTILVDPDKKWYYDLKFELRADESDVEYIWKLHRDSNKDKKIGNGVFSSAGDRSKDTSAIDIVTGGTPKKLWMSQSYKGTYYFKVSDNNLMTSSNNLFSEADWSVVKPYYFRITLTYHGGVSRYTSETN